MKKEYKLPEFPNATVYKSTIELEIVVIKNNDEMMTGYFVNMPGAISQGKNIEDLREHLKDSLYCLASASGFGYEDF